MKKYLMTGVAALTLCAGFTSCSHDDFEPMTQAQIDKAKYDMAFLNYVGGKIAANQDWGFGNGTTRSAYMNANMYDQDWDCVSNVNLTATELAELKALLSPGVPTYNTEIFPYENYWVQQVYKGEATYNTHDRCTKADCDHVNDATELGSGHMDLLLAYNDILEHDYDIYGRHQFNGGMYEHINNFNSGNNTSTPDQCGCGIVHKGTTLMTNMPTEGMTANNQFGFHETWGTAPKYYNNYIIVEYKGEWYVGFDYEAHKNDQTTQNHNEGMDIERDWCFTDWIVKITPAYHKGETPATGEKYDLRIIAEDLSAQEAGDFDFNDVVFDVKFDDANAKIKILAAGGTLPLRIDGKYEVHEALGAGENEMVNTNANGGVKKDPAEIELGYGVADATAAKDITIEVYKNGEWQELTAEKGEPAAKLAVGTDFQWLNERQSIKDSYEKFVDWVNGTGFTSEWWK